MRTGCRPLFRDAVILIHDNACPVTARRAPASTRASRLLFETAIRTKERRHAAAGGHASPGSSCRARDEIELRRTLIL